MKESKTEEKTRVNLLERDEIERAHIKFLTFKIYKEDIIMNLILLEYLFHRIQVKNSLIQLVGTLHNIYRDRVRILPYLVTLRGKFLGNRLLDQ